MRFIPRKTKVKTTLFRNFTIFDCILMLIGVGLTVLIATTNIFEQWVYNLYLAMFFAGLWVMLFLELSEGIRLYFGIV